VKINTTTKKFREGVKVGKKGDEVRWESTGHLSVRLLDASGSYPLVARSVTVDIPGEGTVTLETDDDGELLHRDVPYQDYELDVGGIQVVVPAVGETTEVHERHVAAAPMGFIQALLYDAHFRLLEDTKVSVKFASGATIEATSDKHGLLRCHHADPGSGDVELTCDFGRATTKPLASPQKVTRIAFESTEGP
jgi:hypothetical protein